MFDWDHPESQNTVLKTTISSLYKRFIKRINHCNEYMGDILKTVVCGRLRVKLVIIISIISCLATVLGACWVLCYFCSPKNVSQNNKKAAHLCLMFGKDRYMIWVMCVAKRATDWWVWFLGGLGRQSWGPAAQEMLGIKDSGEVISLNFFLECSTHCSSRGSNQMEKARPNTAIRGKHRKLQQMQKCSANTANSIKCDADGKKLEIQKHKSSTETQKYIWNMLQM